ncbi:replication initiator protein [Capybara microvirus Cap1_SP_128]|nr:replication initiator protein [Capybara microvirus Cap1_SP_128]
MECLNKCHVLISPNRVIKKDGTLGNRVDFFHGLLSPVEQSLLPAEVRYEEVPCGKCVNCKRSKSYAQFLRLKMEQYSYKSSDICFMTFTYDNYHLPKDRLHNYRDFQLFMKRFRKHFPADDIRYYCVGEYGERYGRPHYHVILFGVDLFSIADYHDVNENGNILYYSNVIDKLWNNGLVNFSEVNDNVFGYVSQYGVKSLTSEDKPLVRSSRRGGLGYRFLDDNKDQIIKNGYILLDGKKYNCDKYVRSFLGVSDEWTADYRSKLDYQHSIKVKTTSLSDDYINNILAQKYEERQRAKALAKKL